MAATRKASVRVKRAYDAPESGDGYRVLVDRLWPRGVTKEALRLDGWMKEIAPTPDLRKWFGHDPERWEEFQRRYRRELSEPAQRRLLAELAERARSGMLTLVYGARDREHNGALVLRETIVEMAESRAA
ncbi:MAG TPA: DUF488 domain-containing protein [Chloroflexota bacterium]